LKCSQSLYSQPENSEREFVLPESSACCSLTKQPVVAMLAIEDEEEVAVER
jgi:hypothetical protein